VIPPTNPESVCGIAVYRMFASLPAVFTMAMYAKLKDTIYDEE
jgi:hypothetical protein